MITLLFVGCLIGYAVCVPTMMGKEKPSKYMVDKLVGLVPELSREELAEIDIAVAQH